MFEMLKGFESIFVLSAFGSTNSWATIAKISDFGRQSETSVRLGRAGGRSGVPWRRKRRGY